MLIFSASNNEVQAREGIDTHKAPLHKFHMFCLVTMRYKPERELTLDWWYPQAMLVEGNNEVQAREGIDTKISPFSINLILEKSNNEVQAREGIYKSRAGKPTVLTVGVCQIWKDFGNKNGWKNSRDTCNIDFDMSDFYNLFKSRGN